MKTLTCNQLMLLLSIYRGTFDDEMKIGTHDQDLLVLIAYCFIVDSGEAWGVTDRGIDYIKRCLVVSYV